MGAELAALPPLSLYIHFPWCLKKCPYCDFNSHVRAEGFPEADYVDALKKDLQRELPWVQGRQLRSIFFGGGTPSLMSGHAVEQILNEAEQHMGFDGNVEITLEANPGASEQQRFRDYRAAGVNRISLGAQSFNDAQLQKLGRIHRAEDTLRAVDSLHRAGFDNFNLDLMFALPGQTHEAALADLQQAMELSPPHLSWYQLTLEPNTVFYREKPVLPDDDAQFDMLQAGHERLRAAGYIQYETSAFSRPERQCTHNRNYWEFGDYLGIGAGAHGKITQVENNRVHVRRRQKTRVPEHYLQSIDPCCGDEGVSREDLPCEFFMNALRLTEGVPSHYFSDRTGIPFGEIAPVVHSLAQQDLLRDDPARLATTQRGALLLNSILEKLL